MAVLTVLTVSLGLSSLLLLPEHATPCGLCGNWAIVVPVPLLHQHIPVWLAAQSVVV